MEQNVGEEARRQPEVLSSALVELPDFYFVKRDWPRIKARPRIGIKDSSAPLQFPQISIAAMGEAQGSSRRLHPLARCFYWSSNHSCPGRVVPS